MYSNCVHLTSVEFERSVCHDSLLLLTSFIMLFASLLDLLSSLWFIVISNV